MLRDRNDNLVAANRRLDELLADYARHFADDAADPLIKHVGGEDDTAANKTPP